MSVEVSVLAGVAIKLIVGERACAGCAVCLLMIFPRAGAAKRADVAALGLFVEVRRGINDTVIDEHSGGNIVVKFVAHLSDCHLNQSFR